MQSISIVGIGRAGGALALALSEADYRIDYLVHRDDSTAREIAQYLPDSSKLASSYEFPSITSDIVLIATADPDIASTASSLAAALGSDRPVVLHTSGSLSSSILGSLSSMGCPTGSLHPLVSISDAVSGSQNFSGAYFCIEGDAKAVATAEDIVRTLKGNAFSIPTEFKPLYHAAAVTAAGHIVALIDIAIEMLSRCGVEEARAKDILFPLIASTIKNLEVQTTEQALTGSFARADVAALERHLRSMDGVVSPEIRDVYLRLGERSLDIALSNGANAGEIQRMRELISIAKRKSE